MKKRLHLSFLKTFLLSIFTLWSLGVFAELKEKDLYTPVQLEDIYLQSEKIKNTTLLVTIDDPKSSSGKKLIAAMEKNWKFNPYKIVNGDSINQYISNPKYSILTIYYENANDKNPLSQGYQFGIFLGDEKIKEFDKAEEFVSIAFPGSKLKTTSKGDSILKENNYLFSFFVKNLNSQLTRANQKINAKVKSSKSLCSYYDNAQEILAGKTILICQDGIDAKFDPKAFVKNFNLKPEQLKIVEKKEIENAINKQNDKIAFGYDFRGGNGKLFDASNGNLLAEGFAKKTILKKVLIYSVAPVFAGVLIWLLSGYK